MRASKPLLALAVLALCLAALLLRLNGIDTLLPCYAPLDGTVLVRQVEIYRSDDATADKEQLYGYYPHLVARTVAALPAPEPAASGSLDEHRRSAGAGWVEIRVVSALLSLLMLPATWLLVRRFLGLHAAFAATALLATSLLQLSVTTQVRPHGIAATLLLLTVLASFALRRRPTLATYAAAGLAAGLAFGTLHYGVFALGPLFVAHLLRARPTTTDERPSARSFDWRSWLGLAVALALVLLAIRVFYPFHFTSSADFLRFEKQQEEPTFNLSGQPLKLDRFSGHGFATILWTMWSYEPVMLFFGTIGLVLLARRVVERRARLDRARVRDALVALAFVLPYGLVIGAYDETWERFVVALLPYAAGLAGYAVARLSAVSLARTRVRAGAALAWGLVALTLVPAYVYGNVKSRPDTFELAADWVRANVTPGDRIVIVPYYDLPLFHSDDALDKNGERAAVSSWLRYQLAHRGPKSEPAHSLWIVPGPKEEAHARLAEDPLAFFEANGARYVVVEATFEPDTMVGRARAAVAARGDLVARFAPQADFADGRCVLFRIAEEDWSNPFFLEAFQVARLGPFFEIYRLR